MNLVFWSEIYFVVVFGDVVWDLDACDDGGFVGPASRDVSQSIATAADQ